MINFYDIASDYLDYLRSYEPKVPKTGYSSHEKFFCGIVLTINDSVQYYAPVSSFSEQQRTNFLIYDKDGRTVLSSVRFCFMIPVMPSVISRINIQNLHRTDSSYAILVDKEYSYCSSHEALLRKRAQSVYNIGCNKRHAFNHTCCDFKKLERVYQAYNVL
ncbi:MAG: type III toxin-antitoxin system ToxN/AbiQ family toxin [Synergistaceae bacterium]|nr:type III toxin-antitoxin system ToxN/AbiQ family toxin [Synergistaceae bacterium]